MECAIAKIILAQRPDWPLGEGGRPACLAGGKVFGYGMKADANCLPAIDCNKSTAGEPQNRLRDVIDQIEGADAVNNTDQLDAVDGAAAGVDVDLVDRRTLEGVDDEGVLARSCR